MNTLIKLFSLLLAMGIGGLFFIKKPDGTPWLAINDLKPNVSLRSIKKTIGDAIPNNLANKDTNNSDKVSVYRWQDNEGNWHFSDKAPNHAAEQTNVEQVKIDTHLNRDLAEEFKPLAKTDTKRKQVTHIKDSSLPSPTTVSPDKIGKLVEDAKNIQKLMDNRSNQLESMQ